jgi:drug/metabolite transporter (DMT)-like permease
MTVVLALLAAAAYGTSDFAAGMASRRFGAGAVTGIVQICGLLTAAVAVALGNHLTTANVAGIVIAIPAIALVSWQPQSDDRHAARAGLLYGVLAGLGFALLFIALDRAGTHAGAWPLLPGQAVGLVLTAPFAYRGLIAAHRPPLDGAALTLGAGILSGVASLVFLAATGHGQLAIVAVLTALYPVVTVLLARVLLAERWTRLQATGLVTAAAAIVLVTAG